MTGVVKVGKKEQAKKIQSRDKEILASFMHLEDKKLNGNKEVVIELFDHLLSSKDMDSEIDKIPISYAIISNIAAYAEERYENAKDDLETMFAKMDETCREGDLLFKPTDAKVKAWIQRQPDYQQQCRSINRYKRQWQLFKNAAYTIDMRSRMLQTKSANKRTKENIGST